MSNNMTVALIYIISFFMIYVIGTGAVFIYFRHLLMDEFRKRFLVKRGWGYIRINGNDKRVREYFKDLKKEKVKIGKHTYFVNPKTIKFKGKAGVFEYKEGIAEPIDIYSRGLVGTDSEYLDGFLLKMKSLARVTAAKEMQMILYAAGGAALAAVVAAILAYTNYNTLQEISKILIK